ncbi:MAG: hypothetical protein KAG18_00980, partial [Sinobacterium sp.]|nr:hypothetical protein [Sinobacterium sp.]
MINNKFKLTAIAAAIVAMTACGSDSNNSSAAKPLNDALNSDAFKIASYTGMQTSESINGSWLIVSRGTEAGTVVAADINSGDKVELDGSEESAHVELIQVEEGDVEDSISVSFDCGDDDSTFYKVAENTYETGGDYDYDDGTYTSDFNEDGTCADDEDYCEKYTLTFSPNNVSAELSGEERFDNDGTAYIYNEGGSDYDSEGDNDFDADIFSKIDIPSRSSIEVIFEESYTSSEAGSLVKLSDAARVKFNADGLNYDGLYDKDDAESTFDDTHTASCFAYSSDGSKEVVTTTISGEEESIVTTTLETD